MAYPVLLTVFLLLVVFLFRPGYRLPVAGLPGGYPVWLHDYDFLLDAGGPFTPLSDAFCDTPGLHMCCCGNPQMLVPCPTCRPMTALPFRVTRR